MWRRAHAGAAIDVVDRVDWLGGARCRPAGVGVIRSNRTGSRLESPRLQWETAAVTEVAPLSSPMVRVTYTGFLVPAKLGPVAFAWNVYRSVPVGLISARSLTPSMTPAKTKDPRPFFLKEPGGMVMEKVPTWSVTGSVVDYYS
jgi:hypothetical protein